MMWKLTMMIVTLALGGVKATRPVQAPAHKGPILSSPTSMSATIDDNADVAVSNAWMPSVFGVSKRVLPSSLLRLRGGAVLELDTLEGVEAAILKASSEQKLVVIDFSATWCGPCRMIAPLVRFLLFC